MDDERLRARLRSVDSPVEPRPQFVAELHDRLSAQLGLSAVVAERSLPLGKRTRSTRSWLFVAATLALLVALVVNLAAIGSIVERVLTRQTLLDTIQSNGAVRVAVSPDHPQVLAAGGSLQGFDIDVTNALAERLGVRAELVVLPIEDMLTPGDSDWHVALPSRALTSQAAEDFLVTDPYYRWPAYVLVPREADSELDSLDGAVICVVEGSAGAAWLDRKNPNVGVTVLAPPPTPGVIRTLADDVACLDDLAAGQSAGVVTSNLVLADLVTKSDVRVLGGGPVVEEFRAMIVAADGPGREALGATLDDALRQMRADDTLADLSKRWFGGEDFTGLVP
jgi:ABC-type amino acid transport substrate-binding protein